MKFFKLYAWGDFGNYLSYIDTPTMFKPIHISKKPQNELF